MRRISKASALAKRSAWLWVLSSALSILLTAASPAGAAEENTLELAFRLQDGHFAADRAASRLHLGSDFLSASALGHDAIRDALLEDVDRFLAGQTAPYLVSLDNEERAQAVCGRGDASLDGGSSEPSLEPPDVEPVCTLTAPDFAGAQKIFDTWAAEAPEGHDRLRLATVLFQQIGAISDGLSRQSALFRDDGPLPGIGEGQVRFSVAPPIARGESAFTIDYRNGATAETAALPPAAIRRLLAPLEGHLWRAAQIRGRLQQVYGQRLGLASSIRVSRAEAPRRLEILESPRLSRIVLPKIDAGQISKILFYLLEDRHYRAVMASGDATAALSSVDQFWVLDYGTTFGLEPQELPYLDTHRLKSQLLAMAAIGYSAAPKTSPSPASGENEQYRDLVVLALDTGTSVGRRDDTAPDPTALTRDADPPIDRRQVDQALELSRIGARKNFLGAGLDWKPDQGLRAFGLYRRRPVAGEEGDLVVVAGGFGDAFGSANYDAPFLPVGRLRLPLSLSVEAGSEYTADRRFGEAEFNERRRGGHLRAGLELFRDRGGHALGLSATFRDLQVDIEKADSGDVFTERDLTLLELGLVWSRIGRLQPLPSYLELDAAFTYGLERDDAPSFERLTARLSYHRDLDARFAVDFRAHVGWASSETPVFELPSLGGAESLRGFRSDSALGERLASLQSELWTPITPWQVGPSRWLRVLSQLRLAIFADVGEVENAVLSEDGLRAGAGLGLRYSQPPITLALDWGYGFESPLGTERESKIYLSFRRVLP